MARSNPHYQKTPCKVCGKPVSTNGLGRITHMRKHVREGLVTEGRVWNNPYATIAFCPTSKPNPYKQESD